jgi:hypothetical protein
MRGNQLPVLPPGGSIVSRYILQLLFGEKSQTKLLKKTQQPLKLTKNEHIFGILRILDFFWCMFD